MTRQKITASDGLAATARDTCNELGNYPHYTTTLPILSSDESHAKIADLVNLAGDAPATLAHCHICGSKRFWRRPSDSEPLCTVCYPPPPGFTDDRDDHAQDQADEQQADEQQDESTFWDDFEKSANISAELRKEERLAMCGKPWVRPASPETGKRLFFTLRCECWRGGACAYCLDKRASKFSSRIDNALESGDVYMVTLDNDDADKLARRLKRSQYLRLPSPTGDVFFTSTDVAGGQRVDAELELDWLTLAMTPEGRNVSGGLGMPEPKPDDRVSVKALILHPDTTKDQEDAAWDAAVEATADLQPTTVEEAIDAVEKRIDAFADALRDQGTPAVGERMVKVECRISRIQWSSIRKKKHADTLPDDWDDIDVPF